jgi:hypothetical protein
MSMIHLLILAIYLLATIANPLRPGGVRAVVVESLLLGISWSPPAACGGGRRTKRARDMGLPGAQIPNLAELIQPAPA